MTVTCGNPDCTNYQIAIEITEPDPADMAAGWTVICGVCGTLLHETERTPN